MYVDYYSGAVSTTTPTGIANISANAKPNYPAAAKEAVSGIAAGANAITIGVRTFAFTAGLEVVSGFAGLGALGSVIQLGFAQSGSLAIASGEHFLAAVEYSVGNSRQGAQIGASAASLDNGIAGAIVSHLTDSPVIGNLVGTATNVAFGALLPGAVADKAPNIFAAVGILSASSLRDAINAAIDNFSGTNPRGSSNRPVDRAKPETEHQDTPRQKSETAPDKMPTSFSNGDRPRSEESRTSSSNM